MLKWRFSQIGAAEGKDCSSTNILSNKVLSVRISVQMKSLYFSRKSVLINMDRVSIAIYLLFALSNWVLQLPAAPPPLTFEMSSLHSANAKSGVVTDYKQEQTLFRTNEWA